MLKLLPPIVIVAAAGAASAQDNCHPRDDVFAYLAGEYGELPVAMGLSDGSSFQTWANTETGSWTILVVHPDGTACMLTAGGDFMTPRQPAKGEAL